MTATSPRDEVSFELSAEAITVRIRWFGLAVGYALVNFLGRTAGETHAALPEWLSNRQVLNGILTLGAVYAIADTYFRLRGRVFLSRAPMVISGMEALFIGLLCHFDDGLESPFRFYYFLSLLSQFVVEERHPPSGRLQQARQGDTRPGHPAEPHQHQQHACRIIGRMRRRRERQHRVTQSVQAER